VSAPAFLVDECLPIDVTLAIRQHDLDVTDLFERGCRGLDDPEVWALAASENRILVTRDLDSLCAIFCRARLDSCSSARPMTQQLLNSANSWLLYSLLLHRLLSLLTSRSSRLAAIASAHSDVVLAVVDASPGCTATSVCMHSSVTGDLLTSGS
jgi:hypothetical protein